MTGKALPHHFSALKGPRQAWKVVYPLSEILLCATMAGAEGFVEIERWANRKFDFLRRRKAVSFIAADNPKAAAKMDELFGLAATWLAKRPRLERSTIRRSRGLPF